MLEIGIPVYKEASLVLSEIDSWVSADASITTSVTDAVKVGIQENVTVVVKESGLEAALAETREQFKDLDAKILGYVGYFASPLEQNS